MFFLSRKILFIIKRKPLQYLSTSIKQMTYTCICIKHNKMQLSLNTVGAKIFNYVLVYMYNH